MKDTMKIRGTKRVVSRSASIKALTHSYTIMPTVNLDGKLTGKLFNALREVGGALPTTILSRVRDLGRAVGNIYVTASKSGKIGVRELQYYGKSTDFGQ